MSRHFEPGDVLAFRGTGFISRAIELATFGPSHVGIVCDSPIGAVMVESTTLCDRPCLIAGVPVKGVQVHRPEERIEDYGGRAAVYRLTSLWRLTPLERCELSRWLLAMVKEHEGYNYGQAVLSATALLKWFDPPEPGSLFCSELVAAIMMRLGRLPVSNPIGYSPAGLIRDLLRTGIVWPAGMN